MTNSKNVRWLICIIALMLAMLTAVACNPSTETPGDTTPEEITTAPAPDDLVFAGPDKNGSCSLVCPNGKAKIFSEAELFIKYVNTCVPGANLQLKAANSNLPTANNVIIMIDEALESNYRIDVKDDDVELVGKTQEDAIEALRYFMSVSVSNGYFSIAPDYSFSSNGGPLVSAQMPEQYYYYEDIYTPSLYYEFEADSVDPSHSRIVVSGKDVTEYAEWSKKSVTVSGFTVDAGNHTVLVALGNGDGDVAVHTTSFTCGDGSKMNLYSGEVHAHTSDSDGKGTIKDAYAYARDVAKLDFFAVTDHSNSFASSVYKNAHITNTDEFNEPGKFAALYGYEQTYNFKTGYFGHLNVIGYKTLTLNTLSLSHFYTLMSRSLPQNVTVMFNHPGYSWGNFLEYDLYSEEIDKILNLSEIKGSGYNYEYSFALTKGWHISPVYNEDNHTENWGSATEACGYVLAPVLTRQNVMEAFAKNRTYTTTDKSLKIYYKINDEWMGARLNDPDKLKVSITLSTEKAQGLGTVSLIAEDNVIVANKSLGTEKKYTWEFELDPLYDYYYVKVSSGSTWCVTAPIWVENREQLTMSEITRSFVDNGTASKADHRMHVTLTNNGNSDMTGVELKYYLSTANGYYDPTATPYATVSVGTIKAGESASAYADVEYKVKSSYVYAVATGTMDGEKYLAIRYQEISDLLFSEIVPKTTVGGTDAYEYFEIYNNSDQPIDLSKATIRYYHKAGAKAADLSEHTWKLSGTIEPNSTMVIWVVDSSSTLTIGDFNRHYGTSLINGKEIIRVTGENIAHTNAVQLELLYNSTLVSRVWYNWGTKNEIVNNKALVFSYPTNYTKTSRDPKIGQVPTPGSIVDGQMPEIVK